MFSLCSLTHLAKRHTSPFRPTPPADWQIAQVALQAKRGGSGSIGSSSRGSSSHHGGGGASSLLPAFLEPWEDLAVASVDLSALANRQERLAFGTEVRQTWCGSFEARGMQARPGGCRT